MASSLPCSLPSQPCSLIREGARESRARAAGTGQHSQPSCDQEVAVEPAPEPEKLAGTCTSHSCLALAVERAPRKMQPLSAGEQAGLCPTQNSPQPQATLRTRGGQQPAPLTNGPGPPSPSQAGTEQQHTISLLSPRRQATSCTHPQTAPSSARAGASPPGCTALPHCCCCCCC